MAGATEQVALTPLKNFAEVDPTLIVVDPKINSRTVRPDRVKSMVESYKQRGQDTPVRVVLIDGKYKLVFGYTRHAAAVEYNKEHPDAPMKLKIEVVRNVDEKAAYISSVVENFERTDPTPIELATQAKTLEQDFGMAPGDVAKVFGKPGSDGVDWVNQIQKLLTLPAKAQKMVEQKQLPTIAALELVGLPEKEVADILDKAPRFGPENRIKGEAVRTAAREVKRKTGTGGKGKNASTANAEEGKPVRKASEVVEAIANLTGPGEDEPVRTLAKKILAFKDGKIGVDALERAFRTLGGAIEENATAKASAREVAEKAEMKTKAEKAAKAAAAKAAKDAAKPKPAPKAPKAKGGKGKAATTAAPAAPAAAAPAPVAAAPAPAAGPQPVAVDEVDPPLS